MSVLLESCIAIIITFYLASQESVSGNKRLKFIIISTIDRIISTIRAMKQWAV